MTDPLDTLRPEVREALDRLGYFLTGTHNHNDFYTIRAELLRLASENAGMNAALYEHDALCEQLSVMRLRAENAEAELAAVRARIAASRLIEPCIQWPVPGYVGKRVRLLVDEPQDDNAQEDRSRE